MKLYGKDRRIEKAKEKQDFQVYLKDLDNRYTKSYKAHSRLTADRKIFGY